MKFNKALFNLEMKELVEKAIQKLIIEKPEFLIFTVNIWTDPSASASAINFDSRSNSQRKIEESNKWAQKYYEKYVAEGDLERAESFKPQSGRNANPADFELSNFGEIKNQSVPAHWEMETDGECWNELEPALKEVGEYAYNRILELKTESDLELSVNGRLDWYEFTWPRE